MNGNIYSTVDNVNINRIVNKIIKSHITKSSSKNYIILHNVKQDKLKGNKISARVYTKKKGLTVDKDQIVEHKITQYASQPVQYFQGYYNNITQKDKMMAMTSNETTNSVYFDLQKGMNIEKCTEEIQQITVAEEIKLNVKGKQKIPSKHDILKSSMVGKPSKDHSFTSEACFEHIIICLLKSE